MQEDLKYRNRKRNLEIKGQEGNTQNYYSVII